MEDYRAVNPDIRVNSFPVSIQFSNHITRSRGRHFLFPHVRTRYNNKYVTDFTNKGALAKLADVLRKETYSREADSSLAD